MVAVLVAALLVAETPVAAPAAAPAPVAAPVAAPAAAPAPLEAPAPSKTKLLILDVQSGDLEQSQRDLLTATLATRATRFAALDVISSMELRQLADLRADQAATGCDDASASCMAELANALGAELVLSTRAGKLDAVTVVTLQLFDVKKATAEGRASVQGWSLPEVTDQLGLALDELLVKATGDQPIEAGTPTLKAGPRPEGSSALATGLLIGGGVSIGVGLIAGVVGAVPAILYSGTKAELVKRTAAFDGSPAKLQEAHALQREANGQRELYNNVGRFGVIAGALLVPLGGGALALGLFMPGPTEGGS